MKGTVRLREIYEQHRDRVEFLTIYIREAHPTDGWWLGGGLTGMAVRGFTPSVTDVRDPRTLEERRAVASRFAAEALPGTPVLVDTIDDAVNKAYAGWPTRLYLVDVDGRVAYAGTPGPWGFKPKRFGEAIRELLGPLEAMLIT